MTIPTNIVFHSELIHGFTQTQHEYQVCRFFLSLSYSPHICLTMDLSVIHNIPIHFRSGTMFHFHTALLALHNSYKCPLWRKSPTIQQLTTLPKLNQTTSCSGSHSSLTSSTSIRPVTKICEFPYSFHFIT